MMIPSQISYPASQGAYYIPGQVRLEAWGLEATEPCTLPPSPLPSSPVSSPEVGLPSGHCLELACPVLSYILFVV